MEFDPNCKLCKLDHKRNMEKTPWKLTDPGYLSPKLEQGTKILLETPIFWQTMTKYNTELFKSRKGSSKNV